MSAGYPIVLDLSDRLVVIVGGGAVGMRKAEGVLAAGAGRVRVVSPEFHDKMPEGVERVNETYRPQHLAGAGIVFAATDSSETNDAIVSDARKLGVLVCRADADEELAGDFSTPAMIRRGELLVAVSSGGSPALSATIRDGLAEALRPQWVAMGQAMQQLRPLIRQRVEASHRRQVFRDLCSDEAFEALTHGGASGLQRWLIQRLDGKVDP